MADTSLQDELYSAVGGVSVVTSAATLNRTRAVYVGVAGNYNFTFDGTNWIAFTGCVAGSVLPLQVLGARHNADSSAPDAGDIVALY